jgi:hypothetical protein
MAVTRLTLFDGGGVPSNKGLVPVSSTDFGLRAVVDGHYTFLMSAMAAAIKAAARLDAVADDFASAMLALGRERMDRALEAIEIMGDAVDHDFERLVVFVTANFTTIHSDPFWLRFRSAGKYGSPGESA